MALRKADTVQAVETSLRLIDGLASLNGASTTQLAAHLDLPKSTAHTCRRSSSTNIS
ncbi:helix-turn-helix domain-containing protein [Halalkalicoccus sp. NIPERK01]|uniref:helix-turn-helix domain-containing protein n=1 Tax=Halalkalicoccus sp. NIPERK01 TaxID=3053469 RepID=UPI0034E957C3